jgi:hypothetical protein
VWTFQVSPALHDLPVGDPANHNSGEFQALFRGRIAARLTVADHHLVVSADQVFDGHPKVGNFS